MQNNKPSMGEYGYFLELHNQDVKAHLNSFNFCPTFIQPASGEYWAKVEQKLPEVFKRFQHDPTFLRTKEKSYGSRAKA